MGYAITYCFCLQFSYNLISFLIVQIFHYFIFDFMGLDISLIVLLCCVVMWTWRLLCKHFSILDKPGPDVPLRPRVPTIQWVGLYFTVVAITWYWLVQGFIDTQYISLLWWSFLWLSMIFVVMLSDELWRIRNKRLRIPWSIRLLVQIIAAGMVWKYWWASIIQLPTFITGWFELAPRISLSVTVLRFVLFMNAINWFDGIYGLSTGISSIGFLTITLLLLVIVFPTYALIDDFQLDLLSITLFFCACLTLITVWYTYMEFKPYGLLRDIGSNMLGFLLAYFALLWGAKIGTMIVVLALPIFDAIRVILNRVRSWNNPMKGDYTHLHHRLLALWWNRTEVRVFIRWFTLMMMILMLLQWTNQFNKIVIFTMMFCIFFGVNWYIFHYKQLPSVYQPHINKDNNDT